MAQSQLYFKKAQVSVIAEASQDTFQAPTAASVILARDVTVSFSGGNYDPGFHRGDVLNMDETPGPLSISMNFKVPIAGSGSAGTGPEHAACLQACGLAMATSAGVSNTFRRTSVFDGTGGNPAPSYSAHVLVDGSMFSLRGGFGNLVLSADVQNVGLLDFTIMGAAPATGGIYRTQALLSSPVYDATRAPAYRGATFATNFGGAFTPKGHTTLSFNLNNNLQLGADANEADGFYGCRIVPGGRPSGTFSAEFPAAATKNWIANQRDASAYAGTVDTGVIGGTAGNRWRAVWNRCNLRPVEVVNRNDIVACQIAYGLSALAANAENTTGVDFELIYT